MEQIDPNLLNHLLTLTDGEVVCPLKVKREDVSKLKAVKVAEVELPVLDSFQQYLFEQGYIKKNDFASMFIYLFNVVEAQHRQVPKVEQVIAYLVDRGFMREQSREKQMAALFWYMFNLGYEYHKGVAQQEARKEKES